MFRRWKIRRFWNSSSSRPDNRLYVQVDVYRLIPEGAAISATPTTPAPSLVRATMDLLRKHAPFNGMNDAALQFLGRHLRLRYFAEGSSILAPQGGMVSRLYIVQRGVVTAAEPDKVVGGDRDSVLMLTEGECFPIGALIGRRPTTLTYSAYRDTFCYELDAPHFNELLNTSPEFQGFCTRKLAALLEQSQRSLQAHFSARASDTRSMSRPLRSILARQPVTISPLATIRSALATMRDLRIGSVVIADNMGRPEGIFTERDVLDRVALAESSLDAPIRSVMTHDPFSLPATASLYEAAHQMARHGFRHILVMDEGVLRGIVSERDLFSLQRLSLGGISRDIKAAATVDELAQAAQEVREVAAAMLAQGVAAEQLTQFVTMLNDGMVSRAIEIAAGMFALPANRYCWLGLGSEGRMEQTLATDQDNAIIFALAAGEDREIVREKFVAFAHEVNLVLDRCGFPLCKGDIMAGNRRWCLTEQEWRELFSRWLNNTHPQALLNSAIFFDFRPLRGDSTLAEQLRDWLCESLSSRPVFLRLMAENALQVRPPLGLLRDFVPDDSEVPGTIDLKKYAARPFVDAARIFALATGVASTGTAQRLRLAGLKMNMPDEEISSAVEAFNFIQLLRLRNQERLEYDHRSLPENSRVQARAKLSQPNRVNPDELNELDRRILKEALRQARKLQSRLQLDYQL